MWHESRHSHLVAFDRMQRQLARMVLVNIEIVTSPHPERECLVIRVINTIDKMLATYTIESIVEVFLGVAVWIPEGNSLAVPVLHRNFRK